MRYIINWLLGNITIKVTCAFPERFLNVCAMQGVEFWNINRPALDIIIVTMRKSGLAKLKKAIPRLGAQVETVNREGLPHWFEKLKRRPVFFAGLCAFLLITYAMTHFVWDFSVAGCEKTNPADILNTLAECGVKTGTYYKDVDRDLLKNEMMLKNPGLAWIAVNFKGTKAQVLVRERVEKPAIVPRDIPADIISTGTGVISKYQVLAGNPLSREGATVEQGDMLVSAFIPGTNGPNRLVHSMANITARTWYDLRLVTPVFHNKKEYTGRETTRYAMIFGESRINLYFEASNPYERCDKIVREYKLGFGENFNLPAALVKETYSEYTTALQPISYDGTQKELAAILGQRLEALMMQGKVLHSQISSAVVGDRFYITLYAEAEEDIAMSVAAIDNDDN